MAAPPSPDRSSLVPVFSREMTLEAHFTFTSPVAGSVKRSTAESPPTCSATTTTTSSSSSAARMTPRCPTEGEEMWKWNRDGAQCYVSCGQHGLTMKYDTVPPPARGSKEKAEEKVSTRRESRTDRLNLGPPIAGVATHGAQNSDGSAKGGSRPHVARPYERRCKSTAQIVLQRVDGGDSEARPREFHGETRFETSSFSCRPNVEPPGYERWGSLPRPCHHECHWKPSPQLPLCSCSHCATLHTLVSSLRHELPCACACPHHNQGHYPTAPRSSKPSPSHAPNSGKYDSLYKQARKGVSPLPRREGTPIPSSRSPSPDVTPTPQEKQFFSGAEKSPRQAKGALVRKHSKAKGRPRTIHIDVYCSSSSSDSEVSDNSSSTLEETPTRSRGLPSASRTLVALGSKKNHYKNDFKLQSKSLGRVSDEGRRSSSGIYHSTPVEDRSKSSALITDLHPLSFCSSPPPVPLERPVSSPPQVGLDEHPDEREARRRVGLSPRAFMDFPLPPPVKPKTLAIAPFVTPPDAHQAFPCDLDSGEEKYRVAEERESSPRVKRDWRYSSRSDSNLSSLQAAFSDLNTEEDECRNDDILIKAWRSPKLERQRYLTKGQEDRHDAMLLIKKEREAREKRGAELLKTPTEVAELAKLSVFKDFSEEELQVISKSLTRRESERSVASKRSSSGLSRHGSFRLPKLPSFSSQDSHSPHPSESSSRSNGSVPQKSSSLEREDPSGEMKRLGSTGSLKMELDDKASLRGTANEPAHPEASGFRTSVPAIAKTLPEMRQIGPRQINVGFFRRFNRFPFSTYTYPGPFQSPGAVNVPDVRSHLGRPDVFGETVKGNRRHGIHFGPPRNPQCGCVSCRIWRLNHSIPERGGSPPRLRSQSLSDISPLSSPVMTSSAPKLN